MRRAIVAGNWKMHGSRTENARLIEELLAHCPAQPAATCVVCPPFVYLQETGRMVRGSVLSLGGQDVCAEAQGAFTGEVSAAMLKDVGCEYVIVGHSERRLLYRGSVKAGNAAELFAMPDVDGGLIGGASLKADEFLTILAAAGPG